MSEIATVLLNRAEKRIEINIGDETSYIYPAERWKQSSKRLRLIFATIEFIVLEHLEQMEK